MFFCYTGAIISGMWNYTQSLERILLEINFDGVFVIRVEKAVTDITMDKLEKVKSVRVQLDRSTLKISPFNRGQTNLFQK